MAFFDISLIGVKLWIWLYLLFSVLMFGLVLAFLHREKLRRKYYDIRFPEKIIKVVIHYDSNQFRTYWRLIPDYNNFVINNKNYNFSDKDILKENDFFAVNDTKEFPQIKIKNKTYDFKEIFAIKPRKKKYMEIHYWYNNPSPISYNFSERNIDFNSSQLQDFKDNDLFAKLLTLESQKQMTYILLLGVIGCVGMNIFIILKMMEVL